MSATAGRVEAATTSGPSCKDGPLVCGSMARLLRVALTSLVVFAALLFLLASLEGIFDIPGLGRTVFQAVQSQEGAVVAGVVTLFVFFYILFNLVVDVLYAALDPRIRYE